MATINDAITGTNVARVTAASTAPVASDPALVVSVSPNTTLADGGLVATANPTNASNGAIARAMVDKAGRFVTTTGHVRELVGVQTTVISASTSETTIITAGGANVFNDLSCLVITSTDAAAAVITIKDATGGTTRITLNYPDAALAPAAPCVLPFPIPIPQAVANNNWTATVSANAGSVSITAVFVKNL